MTQKEIILEQMASCRSRKDWFTPLSDALSGLTDEQSKQHDGSNHSIISIVNHLIFWDERWLKRFKNEEVPKLDADNNATFSPEYGDLVPAIMKLDNVLEEWENELKKRDDALLMNEAFKGYGAIWYAALTQFTIHNAYHIGQIVTLRKQYGNWDPKLGAG